MGLRTVPKTGQARWARGSAQSYTLARGPVFWSPASRPFRIGQPGVACSTWRLGIVRHRLESFYAD